MKIKLFITECRDFLLLWGSQTISSLGTSITSYALVIWSYSQQGTASSLSLLTLCTFLPTILFRFIAGTLADRWNKKRIMLACDAFAACGTLIILLLHSLNCLRVWHLYVINTLLSFMNAFQVPAAHVAASLLIPRKHYARTGGLQGFAGSALSILSPALGSVLLAWGGMTLILLLDLFTFGIAFCTLFFFVRIPDARAGKPEKGTSFWQDCTGVLSFLRQRRQLLHLILFFTAINFLAGRGRPDGGIRTGQNQWQPAGAWIDRSRCFAGRDGRQSADDMGATGEEPFCSRLFHVRADFPFRRYCAKPDRFGFPLGGCGLQFRPDGGCHERSSDSADA